MTGGVTEYLDVKSIIQRKSKQSLWKFLYEAHKMGSLSGNYKNKLTFISILQQSFMNVV